MSIHKRRCPSAGKHSLLTFTRDQLASNGVHLPGCQQCHICQNAQGDCSNDEKPAANAGSPQTDLLVVTCNTQPWCCAPLIAQMLKQPPIKPQENPSNYPAVNIWHTDTWTKPPLVYIYIYICNIIIYNRRKFRSQTSDNMDRWKAEQGRGREKRKIRRKKSRRERVRRKKMQMREKVRKSRNTVFFPMIWGSGGSKSRLAKAAGAEPAGQMRDEKLHAVVARSTFRSQNVQSTPAPDHFWQLRCRKSARRCGAKHILKSKCTKHTRSGPLLEVEMSKKCTPLWREAHFEVKMYKTLGVRTTFGGSDVASLRFGSLHYTIHSTKLQYITLHSTTLQLQLQNYTSTLHYTPLHYLNYNTLRHITLHSTTLHYTIHSTTLHYITLHYTLHTLQYITLHYTPQHYNYYNYRTTQLHSTTLHYTPLH